MYDWLVYLDDASTVSASSQQRYEDFAQQEAEGAFSPYGAPTVKMEYFHIDLERGTRGFGFSIRGGKEFHSMPLFVLRIAENGSADADGRLRVGDQIIEINGVNTRDFTHSEAIELIKRGGLCVRLLIKREAPGGIVSPNHGFSGPPMSISPNNQTVGHVLSRQYVDQNYGTSTYSTYGLSNDSHRITAPYGTSPSTQSFPPQGSYQGPHQPTHLYSTSSTNSQRKPTTYDGYS